MNGCPNVYVQTEHPISPLGIIGILLTVAFVVLVVVWFIIKVVE